MNFLSVSILLMSFPWFYTCLFLGFTIVFSLNTKNSQKVDLKCPRAKYDQPDE